MLLPAVFGIKSSGLNLAANLLILFLVVIWLALVYWTYADARRRIADPMLIGCATAASLFPFVGTIVYMIVRPPEYLDDVRERELEIQAAEARLAQVDYSLCPHCDSPVDRDFLRCPSCMRKLKEPCRSCGRPLDPSWTICPFCESEVGAAAPAPRRTRRRPVTERSDVVAAERRATTAERRDVVAAERRPTTAERREVLGAERRDGVTERRAAAAERRDGVAPRRPTAADRREVLPEPASETRPASEPQTT